MSILFMIRGLIFFHGNTIEECLTIFMNVYYLGVQKIIKPFKIICPNNVCLWKSIELKMLIRKKNFWHDLIHHRIDVVTRQITLI